MGYAPLKGYLQSMSIRIINNFKLMVLRAQTELGALLWICFTPKYMLLIFPRFFFRFFNNKKIMKKSHTKNREKKSDFFLEKNKNYRLWGKTYPNERV